MNSSTGFKKRNLLRPASGIMNKQLLRVFDLSQSELLLNSALKTQASSIQEQINLLDKDKKIRTGEGVLQKSYATVLKKWLKEVQNNTEKEDDDYKIMKIMGVESYELGFRKLWKMVAALDLTITKITQLQIIQLLKYDEMFNTITDDSPKSTNTLTNISKAGYTPAFFQITQVILERNKDLFSYCSELKKKNPQQTNNKSETTQLISQLQSENTKLTTLLQQIQANHQKQSQKQQQKREQSQKQQSQKFKQISQNTLQNNHSNPLSMFKELQQNYQSRMSKSTEDMKRLSQQIIELKTQLAEVKTKLEFAEEEIKEGSFKFDSKSNKTGSYEEALLEEMNKMKKGFEKKIAKITSDFSTREKDLRRKESEYKNESDKLKWQKGLLLKKFEVLSTTATITK